MGQKGQVMSFELATLEAQITNALTTAMPSIAVFAHPRGLKKITLPCAMVFAEEFMPSDDDGTERLNLTSRWIVYSVAAESDPQADVWSARIALEACAAISDMPKNKENATYKPTLISCVRDEFNPDFDGMVVWKSTFDILIKLGESVWDWSGSPPTTLLVAFNEDIGVAENYDQL